MDDIHLTLGQIFKLPERDDLEEGFGSAVLASFNILEPA